MDHHLRGHGRLLHHTAVGSQVTLEDRDAAGLGVGILNRTDEFGVPVDHALQIFGNGLAGAGHQAGIQQTGFGQLGHDRVHAAGPLQVLHVGVAGGSQVA